MVNSIDACQGLLKTNSDVSLGLAQDKTETEKIISYVPGGLHDQEYCTSCAMPAESRARSLRAWICLPGCPGAHVKSIVRTFSCVKEHFEQLPK